MAVGEKVAVEVVEAVDVGLVVGVTVGVLVEDAVEVGVAVSVGLDVAVELGVAVEVAVTVEVKVRVGVAVGVAVNGVTRTKDRACRVATSTLALNEIVKGPVAAWVMVKLSGRAMFFPPAAA